MRNACSATLLLLLVAIPSLGAPADPGLTVQEARDHISAKRWGDAVQSLKQALIEAEQLAPAERDKAAAAIHFYSAVAYAGLNVDADATTHLQTFFSLMPNAKLTAPDKYPPHFVELFRKVEPRPVQVQSPAQPRSQDEHAELRFENFYPGFSPMPGAMSEEGSTANWPVALSILATKAEKRQWEATVTRAEQAQFMAEFWKKRDLQPDTEVNEFHQMFDQRVVFADRVFEQTDARGAASDRGRVFVLLGVPSSVRRRPLSPLDQVQLLERTQLNGSIEQWVFGNTQLPIRIKKEYVSYRFVSQQGIGENVLQSEEPYAQQALLLAMNPNERKKK
jgi:GWxTD domain-containing protein